MTTDIKDILVPMPITTNRLILRGIRVEDAQALFEAKVESYESLHQWMPWAKKNETLEETQKMAAESQKKFERREDLMILGFSRDDGRFIVSSGLHRMDWDLRIFEIGYWVRTSETGKGYASETANALTRYAFHALNASKVKISHASGNDASARVIEKLGFKKEGVFARDAKLPDGRIVDHHWYARFDDQNLPDLKIEWGKR